MKGDCYGEEDSDLEDWKMAWCPDRIHHVYRNQQRLWYTGMHRLYQWKIPREEILAVDIFPKRQFLWFYIMGFPNFSNADDSALWWNFFAAKSG